MHRFSAVSALSIVALLSAAIVTVCPDAAQAGVGKRISTNVQMNLEETVTFGDRVVLSAQVPTSYKSKKDFLKVTATFNSSCFYGAFGTTVQVDGQYLWGVGSYLSEQVGSGYAEEPQTISKTWFLDPESFGGPVITPESSVSLIFTGQIESTTLCYIYGATLVVEAVK